MALRRLVTPKLIVQVRSRDNLLALLAAGESPAWVVAEDREPKRMHARVVNFDGTQMIEAVYGRVGSQRRRDGRLVIWFLDGRITNGNAGFASQKPVRFIEA